MTIDIQPQVDTSLITNTSPSPVIEIHGLTKSYGKVRALRGY